MPSDPNLPPTRYLVRGVDQAGNPVRREVLAQSIAHAEELATEDGIAVRGISVASDAAEAAAKPPRSQANSPNPADAAATGAEETLWTGKPSHWSNLWAYLAALLVIPIPWSFWQWLTLRSRNITLTTQRLRIQEGVLSKRVEETELYRVRDSSLAQNFWQRMVGTGDVTLVTTDATTPTIVLRHLKRPFEVRELFRAQIERVRRVQRVREIEMT